MTLGGQVITLVGSCPIVSRRADANDLPTPEAMARQRHNGTPGGTVAAATELTSGS
jgi:hypothetical protein